MYLLDRSDVRQRKDGPTNAIILEYVGRRLCFDSYLYGFPPGTFFYVELADVPYPEHIEAFGAKSGIDPDALPDGPPLRKAIAEALCAGAMVEAPEYLAELAEPEVEWSRWDRIELERRHRIAESRVKELSRILETDMRVRAASLRATGLDPAPKEEPKVDVYMPPPPPPLAVVAPAPQTPPSSVEPPSEPDEEEEDDEADDEEQLTPRSRTVKRACVAVEHAREIELPQRLPAGARRRLRRMPSGSYVAYGEALDVRTDLCSAMTDARALARKDKHSTVIQWDGEWPVVVRRYGRGGRTVYKVETALRRYVREHRMKSAWERFKAAVAEALEAA